MTIVIDTNVYLSHFRFGGLPTRVCQYCFEEGDVFVSEFILAEVTRLLQDKFGLRADQLILVTQIFEESTFLATPTNSIPALCRDPDDNAILQLAQFVQADFIITGDKDLLVLTPFGPCQIVTPKVFAELVNLT